jgi:hypothetical protein
MPQLAENTKVHTQNKVGSKLKIKSFKLQQQVPYSTRYYEVFFSSPDFNLFQ